MRYRNKSLIFSTHQCINGRNPPSRPVHRYPDSERSLLVLLWAPPCSARPRCFFFRFVGHYLRADFLCIQNRTATIVTIACLHIMHRGHQGPQHSRYQVPPASFATRTEIEAVRSSVNPDWHRHRHDASLRE